MKIVIDRLYPRDDGTDGRDSPRPMPRDFASHLGDAQRLSLRIGLPPPVILRLDRGTSRGTVPGQIPRTSRGMTRGRDSRLER